MATRIQFRRGTATEWTSANPVLASGEAGYETDTAKLKIGNGLSTWTSLDYALPTGGTSVGSVVSTEIAALSAQLQSAINVVSAAQATTSALASALSSQDTVLSNAVSALEVRVATVSAGLSAEIAARLLSVQAASVAASLADVHASVASLAATSVNSRVTSVNTAMSALSARSIGNVSTHGLQSIVNALSNRISAVVAGTQSVTSTELSNEASIRGAADTSIDGRVTSTSVIVESRFTSINAAITSIDDIISGLAVSTQRRVVVSDGSITASVFTNVSGLSLSLTSSGLYEINGIVMWTTSTTQSVAFGFTYPTGISPGVMAMESYHSVFVAGFGDAFISNTGITRGFIGEAQMSTLATAQLSISAVSNGGTYMINIHGLVHTGTTPGTVQLQAKCGTTPGQIFILAGSLLRAFKVG